MKKTEIEPRLFLIDDFLTSAECDDYILWSEQKGYEEAKVQIHGEQVMLKEVRNNSRINFIDFQLAEKIWQKLRPFVSESYGNSNPIGLNEMFRFYKYDAGQQFKRHVDGSFIRNAEEASQFTLMIYLNDDFEGGETSFQKLEVKPKKGMAIVFFHGMRHSGEPIRKGTKYVLRTDIMYKLKEDENTDHR